MLSFGSVIFIVVSYCEVPIIDGLPSGVPILNVSISAPIVLEQLGFLVVTFTPSIVILALNTLLPNEIS